MIAGNAQLYQLYGMHFLGDTNCTKIYILLVLIWISIIFFIIFDHNTQIVISMRKNITHRNNEWAQVKLELLSSDSRNPCSAHQLLCHLNNNSVDVISDNTYKATQNPYSG